MRFPTSHEPASLRRCLRRAVPALLALLALLALVATTPASVARAVELPPAVEYVVRADIGSRTGADPSDVEIVDAVAVTWSDACLGIHTPGVACAQHTVDGYVVWAALGDDVFRYHAEIHGNQVLFAARDLTRADAGPWHLPKGATLREQFYTVRSGDALWQIAAGYNLSTAQLAVANGIADPNLIYAGMRLRIPRPGELPATTAPLGPARCTNPIAGYSLGYPPGWYANASGAPPCSLFDPQPLVVLPGTTGGAAIRIEQSNRGLRDELVDRLRDEQTASMTEVRVAGTEAVRMETTARAGSPLGDGTLVTRYLVPLPGGGTLVAESSGGTVAAHAARRATLDWLMATLYFR